MNATFIIAVHILLYLDKHEGYINSEELAKNICVKSSRVRAVCKSLKKAELIEVCNKKNGGYKLNKKLDEITALMCMEAVEDRSVKIHWVSGDEYMDCPISSSMNGIMGDLERELNGVCNMYLEGISIRDFSNKIFNI